MKTINMLHPRFKVFILSLLVLPVAEGHFLDKTCSEKAHITNHNNNNVTLWCSFSTNLSILPITKNQNTVKTNFCMRMHTHTHTHSIGWLEEVRFQRWSERLRCECVWWFNFERETVQDRQCSIRKIFLIKKVHAHRGKTKNGSIRIRKSN